MSVNDPIGDMLTRIRNGHMARLSYVETPSSNAREALVKVLKDEGYVRDYKVETKENNKKLLTIHLKYLRNGKAVISHISRVSKPGRRVYVSVQELLKNKFRNGLGIRIISTSKGVMADKDAFTQKVGGEVLCNIF